MIDVVVSRFFQLVLYICTTITMTKIQLEKHLFFLFKVYYIY